MATDLVQVTREAVVAVLDTHPDIVSITGRPNDNIVAFESLGDTSPDQAMLAYQFIDGPNVASDGDTKDVRIQITADAPDEATVHELLGVAENVLDQPAFLTLSSPLDVLNVFAFRHGINLDVTLRVSRPYPVTA